MRPGKERPVWLQGGSKEEGSCAPKQHSLPLLWVPKPRTTVQTDSCVAGIKNTGQEGPKRKWGRKTSLVSGILLIIFHNLADNGWQRHCHPGPAAKDARRSFPLRHPALPTFDRGRCEVGMKIKSSFKMCSGFFKYKLIFTCESAFLLVPLSLASSRFASSLSLMFKHLSSEVPRTWILNILLVWREGRERWQQESYLKWLSVT